jgi:hypothetical protein
VSWCWLAALAEPPPGDDLADASAWVRTIDRDGRPTGLLAAWPRGRKPRREAVRMDQRLLDLGAPPAWVSLVLVPPEAAPLFDDPAVSQAMRRVLAGPPFAAVSTLVRDAVHFVGAVTVDHSDRLDRLADDPFGRLYPARLLRVGPGMFGRVDPPAGPAIQRSSGKPWPAAGFDTG